MKPGLAVATIVGAWLLAGAAQAAVAGYCEHEGRRATLVDGAAWVLPKDEDDDADDPEATRVAFSTFALDAGALARSKDREEAFRDHRHAGDEATRFELTIREGAVGQQYLWMSPGTNLSYASNEVGRFAPAPAQPNRVGGVYRFGPADGQDIECEVTFDLALLGDPKDAPPPPGVALPRDGGEPGAAYLAMNRALHAGDIDAMLRALPPERAAELRSARSSPDFPKLMAFAQAISPSQVTITGGRQDGERAFVEFTAVEEGARRVGVAELERQNGRWVMITESTRDPD